MRACLTHFLLIAVAIIAVVVCAVICMGPTAFCNKFSPIVVNPTWAGRPPYDVSALRDKDGARQSSIAIGITPVGDGDEIPKDKVEKVGIGIHRRYIAVPAGSRPYLVPQAKCLLEEIGREFDNRCRQRGFKAKFVVTSMLRTEEDNKRLAAFNGNVSQNSMHRYGTTFDITYKRFWCSNEREAGICDEVLAGILTEFRRQGKCWVLRESNQPCYHITVNPKYTCP